MVAQLKAALKKQPQAIVFPDQEVEMLLAGERGRNCGAGHSARRSLLWMATPSFLQMAVMTNWCNSWLISGQNSANSR